MKVDFTKADGLIPAIIQDAASGDVLMLGFMNDVALAETQRTQEVVFFFALAQPPLEEGRIQRACPQSPRHPR